MSFYYANSKKPEPSPKSDDSPKPNNIPSWVKRPEVEKSDDSPKANNTPAFLKKPIKPEKKEDEEVTKSVDVKIEPETSEPPEEEIKVSPPVIPARPSLSSSQLHNLRPVSLKPPLPAQKPISPVSPSPSSVEAKVPPPLSVETKVPPPLPASRPTKASDDDSSPKIAPPLPGKPPSSPVVSDKKPSWVKPSTGTKPVSKKEEEAPEEIPKEEETTPTPQQSSIPPAKPSLPANKPPLPANKPLLPANKPPLPGNKPKYSAKPAPAPITTEIEQKPEEEPVPEAQEESSLPNPEEIAEESNPDANSEPVNQSTADEIPLEITEPPQEEPAIALQEPEEDAEKTETPAPRASISKKPAKKGAKKTFSKVLLSDVTTSDKKEGLTDLKSEIQIITTPASATSSSSSSKDDFFSENETMKASDIPNKGKGLMIIKTSEKSLNETKSKTKTTDTPKKTKTSFLGGVKLHVKSSSELPQRVDTTADSPSNAKKLTKKGQNTKADDPNSETSNIAPDEQIEILKEFVKEEIKTPVESQQWELKYRMSRDKKGAKEFHLKCDNLGLPTITIIESINGSVFGGFTTKDWKNPFKATYVTDKNAFIFSMYNKADPERDPTKCSCLKPESALYQSMRNGPSFGGDLVLNMQLDGLCDMNESFNAGVDKNSTEARTWLVGDEDIEIHKMEVFAIKSS